MLKIMLSVFIISNNNNGQTDLDRTKHTLWNELDSVDLFGGRLFVWVSMKNATIECAEFCKEQ